MAEIFKIKSGTDIVYIPYRGGAADDLRHALRVDSDMKIDGTRPLLPHIQDGKALAVTGPERWPDLPDVPTLVRTAISMRPMTRCSGSWRRRARRRR